MKITLFLSLLLSITACANTVSNSSDNTNSDTEKVESQQLKFPVPDGMKTAYFASGCFWCAEAIFESVQGVSEVVNGYSGGHTKNPTYEDNNTGKTGHAESIEVIYDPEVIDYSTLIDVYFGSQNPTQVSGQGPDQGSQYRSIIFYQNPEEEKIAKDKKSELEEKTGKEVAAEVVPFEKFWQAEDYHQDYEKTHPGNPYIQNVSIPRIEAFKKKFPNLLKAGE